MTELNNTNMLYHTNTNTNTITNALWCYLVENTLDGYNSS